MAKKLVACCGLACTDCSAYKATKKNDHALAAKTAAEWSAQFHADIKVEQVWCDGCTTPGRKCSHCGECEIRACVLKRGLTTCGPCTDYPCKTITGFFAMVPTAKAVLDKLHAAKA